MSDPTSAASRRLPLAIAGVLLVAIFGLGIVSSTPRNDESRHALVAMEMIDRGDYVVPRLLGRPDSARPPLHAWLIALVSGADSSRVAPVRARAVTLAALGGVALLLWGLGIGGPGERRGPHLLPALMFLTAGLVIDHGTRGSPDLLACLLLTAAVAAFELGRRNDSAVIQWFLSQLLVGAALLAGGPAPLLFYPPILFFAWRNRDDSRFSPLAFAAGLIGSIVLVGTWLLPYSTLAPLKDLRWAVIEEVSRLAFEDDWIGLARHLATYPLLLVSVALPWSLLPLLMRGRAWRAVEQGAREEPYWRLAVSLVSWAVLLYALVPGVESRHLLPVLPFAMVLFSVLAERSLPARDAFLPLPVGLMRHPLFWLVTVGLFGAYTVIVGTAGWSRAAALVLGSVTLVWFARRSILRRPVSPVSTLLCLGLVYGIAFSGVALPRRTAEAAVEIEAAGELATAIVDSREVVCDCGTGRGRRLAWALSREIGRPIRATSNPAAGFWRVTILGERPPSDATHVATAGDYSLWSVARAEGSVGSGVGNSHLYDGRGTE